MNDDIVSAAMGLLKFDCQAHLCMFATEKTGMRTNGPCHCLDRYPGVKLQLRILLAKCKQYQQELDDEANKSDEDPSHR